MTKLIFIFSLVFAVSNGVLYGRDVAAKEEFSQGYRYNRPAPHYLPPYQESSTQASNHYHATATPTPASQQQQHWEQQSWMPNNFGSSNNYAPPTLAPPREKPFKGIYRPDVSGQSNNNPYNNVLNGYNYQNSASQAVFVTTAKPNVGYQYMRPEYHITEVLKPSSGYYYVQETKNSKPTHLPVTDVVTSRPSSSGYNYMQPQASNPTGYFYNKPEKNSYNPAISSYSEYVSNAAVNSNYYNQAYELPQALAPLDFGSPDSSSYVEPTFPTSSATAMSSYQRPNYDYSPSSSSNQIGSVPLTGGHHEPWYMNQKMESNNNYNNWNLPLQQQKQQFRPTSQYLQPNNEFQPPYYKK